MECIACTACIDVCNDVMAKLNRPADLIRYTTLSTHQLKQEKKSFNFRALVYLLICLLSIVALMVSLKNAKSLEIEVIRAKETPYQLQTLDSGVVMITNHFKLELSNQSGNPHELTFKTEADEVQINVTGEVLTLKGETKYEEEKKDKAWHIREQRWGALERSIALPTEVVSDKAKAEFENGILTITLQKAEEVKPKIVNIKAK